MTSENRGQVSKKNSWYHYHYCYFKEKSRWVFLIHRSSASQCFKSLPFTVNTVVFRVLSLVAIVNPVFFASQWYSVQ